MRDHINRIGKSWQLLIMFSIPLIWVVIFCYVPMYGVQIAFKDFNIRAGIWGSQWVGFKHFITFFKSSEIVRLLSNTFIISVYGFIVGTPIPIILAFCVNYLRNKFFKKSLQMITYLPYFISTVVIVGLIYQLFSVSSGSINNIISMLGGNRINFISDPKFFRHLYVWSGVWQGMGYSSIIYIAALSGIDQELYEAATIDGASIWKRIIHIDIPGLMPTIIILSIMSLGSILSVGYEKIYLMQTPSNLKVAEVISTYVYKIGLKASIPQYSYSAAINLFMSVIGVILLSLANKVAKIVGDTSLW